MPTPSARPARPADPSLASLAAPAADRPRLKPAREEDTVLAIVGGNAPSAAPSAAEMEREGGPATRKNTNPSGKDKVPFYYDTERAAQARAAYARTHADTGHRSFSDFVADAVDREVERLQRRYNGGKPWPPMGTNELPRGKPSGSKTRRVTTT